MHWLTFNYFLRDHYTSYDLWATKRRGCNFDLELLEQTNSTGCCKHKTITSCSDTVLGVPRTRRSSKQQRRENNTVKGDRMTTKHFPAFKTGKHAICLLLLREWWQQHGGGSRRQRSTEGGRNAWGGGRRPSRPCVVIILGAVPYRYCVWGL